MGGGGGVALVARKDDSDHLWLFCCCQKLWDFGAMTDMEGIGEEGAILGNTFDILR